MNNFAIISTLFAAGLCSAATVSYTGTLTSPEDTFLVTVNLTTKGAITLQTYGFGGGTNHSGQTISAGGFDPFVGVFSGSGSTALFLDGTADNLSNYTGEPSACPPAGLAAIGSVSSQCGDDRLTVSGLAAGTYTILLTDADYLPNAVYKTTGYLGDGFSDLTGGSLPFQTCYDSSNCNTDTANWALDINTPGDPTTHAPEPAPLETAGLGLVLLAVASYRRGK